jgi:hypothetical protein
MRSKHKHQESMQLAAVRGGNHDRTLSMANGKYDRFVFMRVPMAGSEVTPPLVIDSG